MKDRIKGQVDLLSSMKGQIVIRWIGMEMALRESGNDGLPDWEDESIPYLQLERLDAELEVLQFARITTYQADDFGLCRNDDLDDLPLGELTDPASIFRNRELLELPVGRIDDVKVFIAEGEIHEMHFLIGKERMTLITGEVYEHPNKSLTIALMDESILLQVNGQRPKIHV